MPKINAATVAEHHARQRQALIAAATAVLVEKGLAAVTPAAVGARVGLARSSVYQYFASSAGLLAAIIEEAFPPADRAIHSAMETAATPMERVDAYVRQVLRLTAEGAHRPAVALRAVDMPAECRQRIEELHLRQAEPLRLAVADLGVPDPGTTALLVGGLVNTAMTAVERGADPETVTEATLRLVHHGLSPRPHATDPHATGPHATDPHATGPHATDPDDTRP